MISIRSKISHAEIENIRNNLLADPENILRLPTHLELGGAFGISVAIIQLIADWAKGQGAHMLRLFSTLDNVEQINTFAGTPHGMTALYLSDLIQGKDGNENPSKDYLPYVIPYVKAMQEARYDKTMHGRGTFLCCFASARNEFLFPLYQSSEKENFRTRDEFPSLMFQILSKVAPEALRRLDKNDLGNVSKLVYELFTNTHRHARTDLNGNIIKRGVRGIYVKFISQGYSNSTENNFSTSEVNLNRYLAQAITELKSKSPTPQQSKISKSFLEISVFDTGPGLARRWFYRNGGAEDTNHLATIPIEDEYELVKECFNSGHTSDQEYGRGEGLSNVLESLANLKAFLRLRTGRLCLEQSFFNGANEYSLKHWQPKTPQLADTIGARYTAIIPLGVKRT